MADRWCCFGGKDRTVEDLRARYTDVARKLLMSREGGIEQAANHYLVRHQYDPLHERLRKEALRTLYNKTVRGQREDQDILERAKEIEKERRAEMLRNLKAEVRWDGRRGGNGGGRKGAGEGGEREMESLCVG